jgi:hypothetical protein
MSMSGQERLGLEGKEFIGNKAIRDLLVGQKEICFVLRFSLILH